MIGVPTSKDRAMFRALRVAMCAAAILAVACGHDSSSSGGTAPTGNTNGGNNGANNTTPSTVEITPSAAVTLDALQATQAVSASAKNSAGSVVSANFTWSSDAPAVATIPGAGGTITAVGNGTANITAKTDNGVSGTLALVVQQKATQLSRVSGDAQQGTVNAALGSPIVVQANDRNNNAVAATSVAFTTAAGSLGAATVTTGTDGRASTTWKLPTTAGTATATATLSSDATKTVSFSATAAPGPAQKIVKVDGDGQRGSVNTQLPTQVVAAALDQFNNGVPNVPILFVVLAGGGFTNSAGGSTNASGQTVVTWTLGPDSIASQTLQAANGFLTGSPLLFSAVGIRSSMNTLGPSPFHAGCHLSATINGVTATDLPKISVAFDGIAATSFTLTGQQGRQATLTAVAPTLTRANGTSSVVTIKVYSQTITQLLVYDTNAQCT
jgi:hypothetical protein